MWIVGRLGVAKLFWVVSTWLLKSNELVLASLVSRYGLDPSMQVCETF